MEPAQTNSGFQTTHWSMVVNVSSNPALLEELLKSYWGPIYAFIRRSGHGPDQAADLAQEFITQVILERDLIGKAEPGRGRFRTLLKSSLRNFLIDQHRRSRARGRSPAKPPVGSDMLEKLEPSAHDEPDHAFDRQWAATLLSITLERVATECRACGQERHWLAFESAVIRPNLGQSEAPPLESLAAELGLGSPVQVSSLIQTMRRKFRRTLREVVLETVDEPGLADAELSEIRAFLGL